MRRALVLLPLLAPGLAQAACLVTLKTTLLLTWDAPAAPPPGVTLTGYTLERQSGSGAWTPLPPLGATARAATDAGLAAGQTYTYRIKDTGTLPDGSAGESAYATSQPCVQVLSLPVPQNLQATPQ